MDPAGSAAAARTLRRSGRVVRAPVRYEPQEIPLDDFSDDSGDEDLDDGTDTGKKRQRPVWHSSDDSSDEDDDGSDLDDFIVADGEESEAGSCEDEDELTTDCETDDCETADCETDDCETADCDDCETDDEDDESV